MRFWRWAKASVCCMCFPRTDIDQLITISGMVIRTSQLIPEMQEAFFQCQVCAYSTRVEVDRGRIAEPAVCRHCNNTHSLALVHNRSAFSDKQMVRAGGVEGWLTRQIAYSERHLIS